MSEFYMDAAERWKQRGYEVTITGVVDNLCIDIKKGTDVHVHIASGPISARATMLRPLVESFENEFDGRALAQVNLWLGAVENEQAVVLYEKIKEAMKRLERFPLSPEIVKHRAAVEAMEHLAKRLMGEEAGILHRHTVDVVVCPYCGHEQHKPHLLDWSGKKSSLECSGCTRLFTITRETTYSTERLKLVKWGEMNA